VWGRPARQTGREGVGERTEEMNCSVGTPGGYRGVLRKPNCGSGSEDFVRCGVGGE